jgi:aminoglycoside phosphotransferase (APT) family kinase protein
MALSEPADVLAARRAERPTEATLAWVGSALGARVVSSRRLPGGISAGMDVVELERGDAAELVVLRRYVNQAWLAADPDLAVREAGLLEHLEARGIPVPRLLAVDGDGSESGAACLVMSHVPGRPVHEPVDPEAWLDELVTTVLAIHEVPVPEHLGLPDHDDQVDADVHVSGPVRHGHRVDEELWSTVAAAWPSVTRRPVALTHDDYHPGNVLWDEDRIAAVVDWTIASVGQARADLCYLRLDVTLCRGPELGDEVLAAHRRATGYDVEDRPFWDLMAAVRAHGFEDSWWESYVAFGVDVTLDVVRQRLVDFTEQAHRELGG